MSQSKHQEFQGLDLQIAYKSFYANAFLRDYKLNFPFGFVGE
jgi:hypothetical protein